MSWRTHIFLYKNGAITNYQYNNLNQAIKIYGDINNPGSDGCACSGGMLADNKEGEYSYNWKGDILTYKDAEGLLTTYQYGTRGR